MPILAVNQMGQIISTDPDREDGLGFGYAPECVDQGDLTLGSAYLKSQGIRQQELLRLKRNQQLLDREDAIMQKREEAKKRQAQQRDMAQARMQENPAMKEAITRKALSMGCSCEYSTPMSGNVMTANGLSGRNGLSRDQRVIHDVMMGKTHTAYNTEADEMLQHKHRIEAQRRLRLMAKR